MLYVVAGIDGAYAGDNRRKREVHAKAKDRPVVLGSIGPVRLCWTEN